MRAGYHEVAKSIVMWGIYATGKLFNVRQDDLTGLDLTNQGTGTRSFSSSNQFQDDVDSWALGFLPSRPATRELARRFSKHYGVGGK